MSERDKAADDLESSSERSLEQDREVAKLRAEAAAAKRKHREAMEAIGSLESQVEMLLAVQGEPAIQQYERLKKRAHKGTAAIIPATDWHIEQRVDPDTVNGLNSYCLAIAEQRIGRFYQKCVELIDFVSGLAKVTIIYHPLLGDLISGYIHEELQESNQLSPTEACLLMQLKVCSGIDFLRRETKLPVVVPTCFGNHGRTTQKKRISTAYQNSFEWMTYAMTARMYNKDPGVNWLIGKGYHNNVDILGHTVRFHHGDSIRYHGGVGGITIPVNKAVAAWNKSSDRQRCIDVFGHWHQFLPHYPNWVSCGTLMGYDPFALSIKADFQRPTQTLIVLDREYGITQAMPVFI